MEAGQFPSDLYYHLNVFPIYALALREHRTDILQLADRFIEKFSKGNAKAVHRISTAAIDLLMAYHWPGNVRELENCIERAVLLCDSGAIEAYHLPPTAPDGWSGGKPATRHSGKHPSGPGIRDDRVGTGTLRRKHGPGCPGFSD